MIIALWLGAPAIPATCWAQDTVEKPEAEPIEQLEAAAARERKGGDAEAYDKALHDLFEAYRRAGVTAKARDTAQELLSLREKVYGKTALDTLEAVRDLATAHAEWLDHARAYELTRQYRDLVEKDTNVPMVWLVALTLDLAGFTDDIGQRLTHLEACAKLFEESLDEARAEDVLHARLQIYDIRKDSRIGDHGATANDVAMRLWDVHEYVVARRITSALAAKDGDAETRTQKAREALDGLASFYDSQALEEIGFLASIFSAPRSDDIYSRQEIDAKAVATYSKLEKAIVDDRLGEDDLLYDARWKLVGACQVAGESACPNDKFDAALKHVVAYDEQRFKNDPGSLLQALNTALDAYGDRPAIATDALTRRRNDLTALAEAQETERKRKEAEEAEITRRLEQGSRLADEAFRAYEAQPSGQGAKDRTLALMAEAMTTARPGFPDDPAFLVWLAAVGDAHPQRSTVFDVTSAALLVRDPTGKLARAFHAVYIEHLQEGEYFHEALTVTDASIEQAKGLWPADRPHAARLRAYRTAIAASLASADDRTTMQKAVGTAASLRGKDRLRLFNKVLAAGDVARAISIARQALSESASADENDLLMAGTLFLTADRKADDVLRAYIKRLAKMEINLGSGETVRVSPAALRLFAAAVAGACGDIERSMRSSKPISFVIQTKKTMQNTLSVADALGTQIYDAGMRRLASNCYRRVGNGAKALASLQENDGLSLGELAAAVRAKNWALSYAGLGKMIDDVGQDGRPFNPADTLASASIAPDTSVRKLVTGLYMGVAASLPPDKRPDTFDDLLVTAGQYSEQAAAKAIAQAAARSVGGGDLADIVRKRQELESIDSARRLLPGADSSGLGEEIEALDRQLRQRFPSYAELLNPRSVSLHELRGLLDPDEALVLTVETEAHLGLPEALYVLIITAEEFHWYRAAMSPQVVRDAVLALRCGLDEEEWASDEGGTRCGKLLGISAELDKSRPLPFHLGKANELYEAVFGPARAWIKDKRLLVVPSGALSSLPLHVLVSERPSEPLPATFEGYRSAAWFARSNAIAIVPSAASLASFRGTQRAAETADPYNSSDATGIAAPPDATGTAGDATGIVPPGPQEAVRPRGSYLGYGNPSLQGSGNACPSVTTESPCRDDGAPVTVASSGAKRATVGGRGARRSKGANVDAVFSTDDKQRVALAVRALCPLPDTADEIKCVARHFNEPKAEIRLAAQASEKDLKALSASGALARFRILHFATHGLLAGDVERMTRQAGEPALVMTPPEKPVGEGDDGLLLASEVAALKLDADWVVLSACNTAAADRIGAEALSGLARAFFFAGARSLLVSHWPVYSDAAVRLTTHIFDTLERKPGSRRADALRRSMLALMDDASQEDNPHPAVWAPFVLVGDGR